MNLKLRRRNKWKDKFFEKPDASRMHAKVQEILKEGTFKNLSCYQEVPVSELVENTKDILYVDWFVEAFNLIIELHGIQHYKPTSFSREGKLKRDINFIASHNRDENKKTLLEGAGYLFIEIPYTDESKLSEEYILNKLRESLNARMSK